MNEQKRDMKAWRRRGLAEGWKSKGGMEGEKICR